MKLLKGFLPIVAFVAMMFCSCGTPKNISYFQDIKSDSIMAARAAKSITLMPGDQISIIVNARDPQITMLFNLPYYTKSFNSQQSLTSSSSINTQSANQMSAYTIDSQGDIDFPELGKIHVAGLTREGISKLIKNKLIASNMVKDPIVTVDYTNLGISVLGEVVRPGRYKIDRDQFTILDAISLAGDLTINGQREDVTVIRHNASEDLTYKLDLTNAHQLYSSPAYYLQQGDMIYVTPNDKKQRESTVNGNNLRSSSFWISLASLLTSVAVLIFK